VECAPRVHPLAVLRQVVEDGSGFRYGHVDEHIGGDRVETALVPPLLVKLN
jgi:hypothetical protein